MKELESGELLGVGDLACGIDVDPDLHQPSELVQDGLGGEDQLDLIDQDGLSGCGSVLREAGRMETGPDDGKLAKGDQGTTHGVHNRALER